MRASLIEMDRNEFAKNVHCNSLYKMSVFFCVLIGTSVVRDLLIVPFHFVTDTVAGSMFLLLSKASFDTFFGITVMILLVIFFPSLRPRLTAGN